MFETNILQFQTARGHVALSVKCLTADPGVETFMEIDHEIISTTILISSPDSRSAVVSYKQK